MAGSSVITVIADRHSGQGDRRLVGSRSVWAAAHLVKHAADGQCALCKGGELACHLHGCSWLSDEGPSQSQCSPSRAWASRRKPRGTAALTGRQNCCPIAMALP